MEGTFSDLLAIQIAWTFFLWMTQKSLIYKCLKIDLMSICISKLELKQNYVDIQTANHDKY